MIDKEQRVKEFLECLGNGKTIYQCEEENDMIDEELKRNFIIIKKREVKNNK